jgi:hypothetical protein
MTVPLPFLPVPEFTIRSIETALPDFTKFLASLGKAPANRSFLPSNDRGDLRCGKSFQVPQDQDRAIRDWQQSQHVLNLLSEVSLNPRVGVWELEAKLAVIVGQVK